MSESLNSELPKLGRQKSEGYGNCKTSRVIFTSCPEKCLDVNHSTAEENGRTSSTVQIFKGFRGLTEALLAGLPN